MLTNCILAYSVVPSAAPTGLNVSAVTPVSITIHWELLPCQDQNGVITGNFVQYGEVDNDTSQTVIVPGGENNQIVISDLVPSTEYRFQVAAVNSAGIGNYSTSIVQETDVDIGNQVSEANLCGNITCWISAGGLAAIFSSVVIVLLLLCLVAGCVFRQRSRISKKKSAALT